MQAKDFKEKLSDAKKKQAIREANIKFQNIKELSDMEFAQQIQAEWAALKSKGTVALDERGERTGDLWDRLRENVGKSSNSDFLNYNTFTSSMMGLLIAYRDFLLPALSQTRDEAFVCVGQYAHMFGRGIFQQIFPGKPADPDVVLPQLAYLVELDEEGKLDILDFQGDGTKDWGLGEEDKEVLAEMKETLRKGVIGWLTGLSDGYIYDSESKKITKDGMELNKEAFSTLKSAPIIGLSAYLSGSFDMEIEDGMKPRI